MALPNTLTDIATVFIEGAFRALPYKVKRDLLKKLIKTEGLVDEAASCYYFEGNLNSQRFSKDEILSAINLAKNRFPSATILFVSDEYDNNFGLDFVQRIDPSAIAGTFRNSVDQKVFVCAFESDEKLVTALRDIISLENAYYYNPLKYYPTARYFHRNDIARKVLRDECSIKLPKFEVCDYENIIQAIDITKDVVGAYVEIGVFQGRSAHLALNYMRKKGVSRRSYFIDLFEGFTYDSATKSPDALWLKLATDTSLERVKQFLSEYTNHEICKLNVIDDELPASLDSIAVCNLDVDLYEAVYAALVKTAPLMSVGGVIILEDQGHTPALAGGYLAVCDFMQTKLAKAFLPIHMGSGQMFLVRLQS